MPLEGGRVRAGLCTLGAEQRPAAIQPGFRERPLALPLCEEPFLGSWRLGSRFTASAPGAGLHDARRQRQGLTAVVSRPQGDRRVLVGLWSRPGRAEHDLYAGGRWHGAIGNCWALLCRREATCPGALCRGGLSSQLGPGERPGRRGNSGYAGFLARAGRLPSCRAAVPGRHLGRGQTLTQSSGCWDAPSPLASSLKHPEPDRMVALCCQAPAGVHGLKLGGAAFRQACRSMPPTSLLCGGGEGTSGPGVPANLAPKAQRCLPHSDCSGWCRGQGGACSHPRGQEASFPGKQPWVGGLWVLVTTSVLS